MKVVPIWQIKFCTQMVLVDTNKVPNDKLGIFFVADRNHTDLYVVDGTKVRRECEVTSNGKIPCFNIPLSWLVPCGKLTEELENLRKIEYEKFKKFMEKSKKK